MKSRSLRKITSNTVKQTEVNYRTIKSLVSIKAGQNGHFKNMWIKQLELHCYYLPQFYRVEVSQPASKPAFIVFNNGRKVRAACKIEQE